MQINMYGLNLKHIYNKGMNIKKGYASLVDQQPWVSCRWAFEPSCYGSRPWHSSSCPSSRMASFSSSELEPSILSTVPSSPIGLPSFFNFSDLIWDLEREVWRIISFSLQSLHFVVFGQNSHQWVLRELLLCLRLALVFVWLNVFLLLVMSLLYVWRGQALLLFICTEMIKINNGLCIWYNLKLAPPRPSFLTFR